MIKRFFPTKDTFITSFKVNNVPMTGSNFGFSEIAHVFKKSGLSGSTGPLATGSLGRLLTKFDTSVIAAMTASGEVSTNARYYLKMFDARHDKTLPYSYDMEILPLSKDWDEGRGTDNDDFSDKGIANWDKAKSNVFWTTRGGDFFLNSGSAVQHFDTGEEDIEVEVTSYVNAWLAGTSTNNGLIVKVSSTLESDFSDYYVKMFHTRHTNFMEKRPYLEARWDDSMKDDRNNFVWDNTGSLFLYNRVRGQFVNISGVGTGANVINVRVTDVSGNLVANVSASHTGRTGIYSASFAIASSSFYSGSRFTDTWLLGSRTFMQGVVTPADSFSTTDATPKSYHVTLPEMRNEYEADEKVRFRIFTRNMDYNPAVQQTASLEPRGLVITKGYYRIDNDKTNGVVIPFGTGSVETTRLSYDDKGNYFELDMSSLPPRSLYRIVLLYVVDGQRQIIDHGFKFRIV